MLVDPATVTEKQCTQCNTVLGLEHFYPTKTGKYGCHSWCKNCMREDTKTRYKERLVLEPTVSEKTCPKCNKLKPAAEFSASVKQATGLKSWCRKCDQEVKAVKYHSMEEKDRKLRQTFNISLEEYTKILEAQDYVCAICKKPCTRNLAVDHDHSCCSSGSCGKCVRGLLCKRCNMMLGSINDDVQILKAAMIYLGGE